MLVRSAQTAYLPVETVADDTLMPVAETKPTGDVYTRDGVEYTRLYGTQLGSNFIEDPVQGVVRSSATLAGSAGSWGSG